MSIYRICHATDDEAEKIEQLIPAISQVKGPDRAKIVDAFCSVWRCSGYESLADAPFSRHNTHYRLVDHINEVVDVGMWYRDFALARFSDDWAQGLDEQLLLELLLLHDIDKFMLLADEGLEKTIAHGVLAGLLLNELGFDERVVKLVICHSPSYHMHIADPMAMCLHYADLFSCDHIHMVVGREPFFVR